MEPFPYTRLVVVGATSSGESTLAERLSQKLNLDFVELDALHWRPGWVEAPNEEFRALANEATRAPAGSPKSPDSNLTDELFDFNARNAMQGRILTRKREHLHDRLQKCLHSAASSHSQNDQRTADLWPALSNQALAVQFPQDLCERSKC